jgi:hypothetical protein
MVEFHLIHPFPLSAAFRVRGKVLLVKRKRKVLCMIPYRFFSMLISLILFMNATSFALTVEEVIQLKKEGVSDEIIQLMIQQEMQREKLSEAETEMGVTRVEEPDGRNATVYSTGPPRNRDDCEMSEREKRERAWDMLDNIIIDTRDNGIRNNVEREK